MKNLTEPTLAPRAWRNATMAFGTIGEPGTVSVPCEISITEREISLSYKDERGHVVYRGRDQGGEHFSLAAPERAGHASLHRFPKGNSLEGFWREDAYHGWWKIDLHEPYRAHGEKA